MADQKQGIPIPDDEQHDLDQAESPYAAYEVEHEQLEGAEDIVDETEEKVQQTTDEEKMTPEHIIAHSLSSVAESFQKAFPKDILKKLKNAETRDEAREELVNNLRQHEIIGTTLRELRKFEVLELDEDVISPAIYERIHFLYGEALKRAYPIFKTLIDYPSSMDEAGYKELIHNIEGCKFFISNVLNEALHHVGEYANSSKEWGELAENFEDKLNVALRIPGYPLNQIKPIHATAESGDKKLSAVYTYYRDSANVDVDEQRLDAVRTGNIKNMTDEIDKITIRLFARMENKEEFLNILKDREAISDEEYERIRANPDELLNISILNSIRKVDLLQDARIGMLLHDEGLIDEDVAKIATLLKKIERQESLSADDLYEKQLQNENFRDLKLGKVDLEEISDLYDMWQEVKTSLPAAASSSSEAAA
jgi:ligand-binding sensor protein